MFVVGCTVVCESVSRHDPPPPEVYSGCAASPLAILAPSTKLAQSLRQVRVAPHRHVVRVRSTSPAKVQIVISPR